MLWSVQRVTKCTASPMMRSYNTSPASKCTFYRTRSVLTRQSMAKKRLNSRAGSTTFSLDNSSKECYTKSPRQSWSCKTWPSTSTNWLYLRIQECSDLSRSTRSHLKIRRTWCRVSIFRWTKTWLSFSALATLFWMYFPTWVVSWASLFQWWPLSFRFGTTTTSTTI